jgi:HTH-type transcriptional regulator, sugar sensing transcriptional regulator
MKDIQRALEKLGYQHNEMVVYLAALRLGEATVAEIARKVEMPRSTTQLVILDLQKKGLMNRCMKRQHPVWLAESPSHFLMELHEKEALVKSVLPSLQALRHETKSRPLLKYYNGVSRIDLIFKEVLLTNYPVQVLGSVPYMLQYLGQDQVEDFFRQLFKQPIPVQVLTADAPLIQELKAASTSGQSRIRVYDDERLHKVVYILFGTQVAVILLGAQELLGVIFEDEGLAESSALFFERLWEDAAK